jgi:Domain of unknown function (DUF1735).
MKINKRFVWLGIAATAVLTSCENSSVSFPDFEYQTAYFANPYVDRTLQLGEDRFVDLSLDNQHKVEIQARMGGAFSNKRNILIDILVDNALCDDLYFEGTNDRVVPLPSSHYRIASNQIEIKKGSFTGGLEVEFTEAFFQDPLSLTGNYAIPLRMTNAVGVDSILQGTAVVDNPDRLVAGHWSVAPRDYVFYAMKYVNPWHGFYLRRGIDTHTKDGVNGTTVRHRQYVEEDQVIKLSTTAFKDVELPVVYASSDGINLPVSTILTFDNDENCTISPKATAIQVNSNVRVSNITAQGSGKFVKRGEKDSMGGKDRDAIYLDYEVSFNVETASGIETQRYLTKDTLVLRDRGVAPGYFAVEKR